MLNELQIGLARRSRPSNSRCRVLRDGAPLLQILAPNEALVAISIEVRLGETAGVMNLAVPSICIKMLRQQFDQQWSLRRSESTEKDQVRAFTLVGEGKVGIDARLQGPTGQPRACCWPSKRAASSHSITLSTATST